MKGDYRISLFDVAAERKAYEGAMQGDSRPLSQVRAELVYGRVDARTQTCASCGGTFIAAPRADSTCNLCRRGRACADCGSAHGANGACGGGF
jgi:hypothetical protein